MAATTTKPAYTVRWRDEENERNLRKLFFAAAADIPDQMLSSFLAQPLVRIALKLLELLRAHRAAHAGVGAYVPPDDATQDNWMQTDGFLLTERPFCAETRAEMAHAHWLMTWFNVNGTRQNSPRSSWPSNPETRAERKKRQILFGKKS
jgi:hypothetical protein